jgi:hypothetical protein
MAPQLVASLAVLSSTELVIPFNLNMHKILHGNPPSRILKYVSHDGVWHTAIIITHSNVASPDLVLLSYLSDTTDQLVFSCDKKMNI